MKATSKLSPGAGAECAEAAGSAPGEHPASSVSLRDVLSHLVAAGLVDAEPLVGGGAERPDGFDQLTQLMDDMAEFVSLAQMAASIVLPMRGQQGEYAPLGGFDVPHGPRLQIPNDMASLGGLDGPYGPRPQHGIEAHAMLPRPDELLSEDTGGARSVFVALRVNSLLQMTFHEALTSCSALANFIGGQEDPALVEEEFAQHWHQEAPAEMRFVLEELVAAEEGDEAPESRYEDPLEPYLLQRPVSEPLREEGGQLTSGGAVRSASVLELRRSKL